jgi:hypothetical protein
MVMHTEFFPKMFSFTFPKFHKMTNVSSNAIIF